jgi:peptide/nickel transport system permease protein
MTAYIIRRIGQAIIVVIGVTILVFITIHLIPGGPARALLGPRASQAAIRNFLDQNGYNRPLIVQYVSYAGKLLHGNLGYSYYYNQSVNSLLAQDLPKTLLLVGCSLVVALVVAIPIGILQAVKRNKPVDYVLTGVSFVGYAMPTFWVGLLLILAFSVKVPLFPSEGPQGATVASALSQPRALVLPVATLSIITIAQYSRFMRAAAIDNLVEEYVRTARSKGISERQILVRHILRNSVMPIITLIGLNLPFLVSGAVITETVFNYPGMGLLFWNAAQYHDYPTLLGFTVVVAVVTVVGSLLADILYAAIDPRVRYA